MQKVILKLLMETNKLGISTVGVITFGLLAIKVDFTSVISIMFL